MTGIVETLVIGSALLGGVVQTVGSIQQGNAAKAQADYAAGVAANNAVLAQRAAQDARDRGAVEEARKRQETRQLIGRQNAVLAGNGVLVNQDSALDLTADSAAFGELDALTVKSNAQREALGFETQGMNFQNEASLNRLRGANAQQAGIMGGISSVLGTAGKVAGTWYQFQNYRPRAGL